MPRDAPVTGGGGKPGEEARRSAIALLAAILKRGQAFDESFEKLLANGRLDPRDRAFLYALVATTLRHKGEIEAVLATFMTKKLPRSAGPTDLILLTSAAQLLFMDTPAHAAVDLAVAIANEDRDARHFAKLVNAVLRKVAKEGEAILSRLDAARLNTPSWLWQRWCAHYGEELTRGIADAHRFEPALDLSAKRDPALWAERLGGTLLPTGTIRLKAASGAIEDLAGYHDGAWFVQDAAARLPVRLLGDVAGKRVLDLCAAPGGKTAQLAAQGAWVTAVDRAPARMVRLKENLARLDLSCETMIADAENFASGGLFDAVLLDAPCSATGTIRRHPDLPYIKDEAMIGRFAAYQARLLAHAAGLAREGGMLVYCTCSLEPEEGERQIEQFLAANPGFARLPVTPGDVAGQSQFINSDGDLRTHPAMKIGGEMGLDGFFAVRLVRQ